MDNQTYLSTVEEVENRIPEINRFLKEEVIPNGMIECPTCVGYGVIVAMAHTAQLTIICPCCKGSGVVDDGLLIRMMRGKDLFLIRKSYDIHILTAAKTLQMSASHINDIERGFCETADYEKLKRAYLKEFAGIELPEEGLAIPSQKNQFSLNDSNSLPDPNEEITWNKLYLLGAIGRDGEPLSTTFLGNQPIVHVVLTGVDETHIPFWKGQVPDGAQIHPIPEGEVPEEYAKKIGGIYAYGWYYPKGFER